MIWLIIIVIGATIFVTTFHFLFDLWVDSHLKNIHNRYNKEDRHVDQ